MTILQALISTAPIWLCGSFFGLGILFAIGTRTLVTNFIKTHKATK